MSTEVAHIRTALRHDRFVESFDGTILDVAVFSAEEVSAPRGGWPVVVFGHGGGGTKEIHAETARVYASQGYLAMTFSAYGHGSSQGVRSTDDSRLAQDIASLVAWLEDSYDVNPQRMGLTGNSYGALQSWQSLRQLGTRFRTAIPMNAPLGPRDQPLKVNNVQDHWVAMNAIGTMINGLNGPRADQVRAELEARMDDYNNATSTVQDAVAPPAPDQIVAPTLVRSAWLDVAVLPRDMIDAYQRIDPPAKRLQMATGGHGSPDVTAEIRNDEAQRLRWFDYWLRGIPNGIMHEPPVNYSIPHSENPVSAGEWIHRQFDSWPPPSEPRRLYAGEGLTLDEGSPATDGRLSLTNVVNTMEVTVAGVDRRSLLLPEILDKDGYEIECSTGNLYAVYTVFGQPETWAPDEVVLVSEPLTESLEFAGHFRIRVEASSTAPEFQVNTFLLDIAPGGTELVAASGVYGVPENVPGQTVEVDYEGIASTHLFPQGHRVGLRVSNSALPYYKPYFAPGETTLHFGPDHPFFVEIPVLPAYQLPEQVVGVTARDSELGVELQWNEVPGDVVGYRVYRRRRIALTWADDEADRVQDEVVQIGYVRAPGRRYFDFDPFLRPDDVYRISAVGPGGVEGRQSEAVLPTG